MHNNNKSFKNTCIEMCFSEGMLVVVITLLLHYNFAFLKHAVELDSMLFYYFAPKDVGTPREQARPVFFIDINDTTMAEYYGEEVWGRSTPRRLQGQILEHLQAASPAVVVMDFDYREPHADDASLRRQLELAVCPVVIPRIFFSRPQVSCAGGATSVEYEVPPRYITGEFDDLGPKDGVYFARTDVESMFGYTVGFCTSVTAYNARGGQERIPAAALLVPSLAGNGPLQLPEPAVLERFYIRVTDDVDSYNDGALRFVRMPAHHLFAENIDMQEFNGAIVVVSASHSGANDTHYTIEGLMPGGLVLSNAILQMLSGPILQYSEHEGFVIDIIFVLVQSVIICLVSFLCKKFIWKTEKLRQSGCEANRNRIKIYGKCVGWWGLKLFLQFIDKTSGVTIPFCLLWVLHTNFLYEFMHVNSYVLILPVFLSFMSLFFEHRHNLWEYCESGYCTLVRLCCRNSGQ